MITKFFLILILIMAFALRIFSLNSNPPGLTWDEAALGYNAYSVLKTGKDEWGQNFPLIFKSFGDYKPGLYVYLDVPFVALFGLNEVSVRLPSVLLGSMLPLVGFLIVNQILPGKKEVGVILAALLAISPWAIHFSRSAWEANVAFLEILLALYFLLKARGQKKIYFVLSIALFSLSVYTYQSAKLLSFLFLLGLVWVYRKDFLKKDMVIFTLLLVVILGGVLASSVADPVARARLAVLNQYSYKRSEAELSHIRQEDGMISDLQFQIFHSEQLEYLRTVTGRYLNYFSPKFLFIQGPEDGRQGVMYYGMVHLFELPFSVAGLYFFFRKHLKEAKSILLLAALAPLPAALSREVVSTVRSLPLVFPLEFLSALGIFYLLSYLRHKKAVFYVATAAIFFAGVLNLSFYLDRLIYHFPILSSEYYLHGYKEAVNIIRKDQNQYQKVIFTTAYNEPYIFYLFYSRYDPVKFQQQAVLKTHGIDVGEVPQIDDIEFRSIYWPKDRFLKGTLYVGTDSELPDKDIDPKQAVLLETVKFLNNRIAFKVVGTN